MSFTPLNNDASVTLTSIFGKAIYTHALITLHLVLVFMQIKSRPGLENIFSTINGGPLLSHRFYCQTLWIVTLHLYFASNYFSHWSSYFYTDIKKGHIF